MRKLLFGLTLAATCALYTVTPVVTNAQSQKKPQTSLEYTLELVDADMWGILDINNGGEVLIERQLVEDASPAPLIIKKNGKETAAFECPGTTNDTNGVGINNHGDIVGHCGHVATAPGLFAFVANPKTGSLTLLAYPGAQTTWGFGINDFGDVVGVYENDPQPPLCCFLPPRNMHGFSWNKKKNQFRTIEHPFTIETGWPTFLGQINNKGQIVGFYATAEPFQGGNTHDFIYDNGTFTPIEFPGADQTHITGFNNNSQILGWYYDIDADCSGACVFLFDSGEYFAINLPLPANEPRPDGAPAGIAFLSSLGGLNDKGQFVGTYLRIAEWRIDMFGNLRGLQQLGHFIATPQKPRKK